MIRPSRYLFIVTFAIFPHLAMQPTDILAALLAIILWASMFCFKSFLRPTAWLLRSVTLSCVAYVYLRYGSLANPDAATSLLCMITVLKLFETESYRDAMALLLILPIVVMSYLIHSYSLLASAYMVSVFFGLIYLLMELQRKKYFLKQNSVKWSDLFSWETVVALPLLVTLFVFFPRFSTRMGSGERIVQTVGFSDQIELGQLISLTQSNEIAFKVRFMDTPPKYDSLYFRGAVLTRQKEMSWKKSSVRAEFVSQLPALKSSYQVFLPARNQKNFYTLENGTITQTAPRVFIFYKKNENLFSTNNPLEHNMSYSVATTAAETASFTAEELPPNTEHSDFLKSITSTINASTFEQKVENILLYFKNNNFSYSTDVPGYKSIDDFLKTKIGFCEHFASAFVTLARSVGLPGRVVVGFMGGELNPFDDTLVVRDKYAHAWAEVYDTERGWVRVDPTSVVYPQRLQNTFALNGTQQKFYEHFFANSILFLDSLNNKFELFLMNFNSDSQLGIISSISSALHLKMSVVFVIIPLLMVTFIVGIWWLWGLHFAQKDPVATAYQKLLHKISRKGVQKAPYEGPMEFELRVMNSARVPEHYIQALREYIEVRYSEQPDKVRISRFQKSIRALK